MICSVCGSYILSDAQMCDVCGHYLELTPEEEAEVMALLDEIDEEDEDNGEL